MPYEPVRIIPEHFTLQFNFYCFIIYIDIDDIEALNYWTAYSYRYWSWSNIRLNGLSPIFLPRNIWLISIVIRISIKAISCSILMPTFAHIPAKCRCGGGGGGIITAITYVWWDPHYSSARAFHLSMTNWVHRWPIPFGWMISILGDILTINGCVIYAAPSVMILMRANPILGPLEGGLSCSPRLFWAQNRIGLQLNTLPMAHVMDLPASKS